MASRLYSAAIAASAHSGQAHIQPKLNDRARLARVAIIITRARPSRSDAAPPTTLPNTLTRCANAASAMPAAGHALAPPRDEAMR
ncbi:hypothetical protein FQZ97_818260 [compost metagenome]